MDPFLESHWRDVHSRLVAYGADALAEVLPDDLIARMEERVAIESDEDLRTVVAPDVRMFEAQAKAGASPAGPLDAGPAAVAVPVLLTAVVEPVTERFIRIVEADSGKLVTVVEFLSPTNKRRGEGMRDYRAKRQQLLDGGVNVVEVDLVRQGDWVGVLLPFVAPARHHTPYRAIIRRADKTEQVELYPIAMRERLPFRFHCGGPTNR
jgi:hypothetical protein